MSYADQTKLIVWDTQTGVAIGEIGIQNCDRVVFHGDQRTITLIGISGDFYTIHTYDAVSGTQLCQDRIPSPLPLTTLGPSWAHKDTIQFATSFQADGKIMINIYELQPTSPTPLHTVSSFPMPFHTDSPSPVWSYEGKFSFSPVSFHASFFTRTEFIILDVQGSQVLLQTKLAQVDYTVLPKFSADGHFVACRTLENEICVWKNVHTCYVLWCSLKAQLLVREFSWSPSSVSIFCHGVGIQLLHPDSCLSLLSPNEAEPHHEGGDHLVAYSADEACIAIARQDCSIVTVLDFLLGIPQQVINTDMRIYDIKIIDNTIFVTDGYKLISWELEAAGVEHCGYSAGRVINESLTILYPNAMNLRLSYDCSQIAYTTGMGVAICNIQVQKTYQYTSSNLWFADIKFSPSDHQLWFMGDPIPSSEDFYIGRLRINNFDDQLSESQGYHVESGWSWNNLFSSYGYHVKRDSEWVTDSRGRKLLWLPPAWRTRDGSDVRWDGKFLGLLGCHRPKPIIIEFQPQSILPHS